MSVGAGSVKRAAKSALTADAAGTAAEKGKKTRTKTVKTGAAAGQKDPEKKTPETEGSNEACQVGQPLPVHLL